MDHLLGDGVNIDPSKFVPQDLTKILMEDIIHQKGEQYSLVNIVPLGNS